MENYINRRLQLNSIIWIEIIICFLINFVDYWFNSNKWCANPFSKSMDKCCSPSFMFCKYFFSFHSQHFIYITLFIGRGIFCIWAIKPNIVSVKCTRPYLQNWNVLCNRKVNFNTDKNLYINDYTNETKRINIRWRILYQSWLSRSEIYLGQTMVNLWILIKPRYTVWGKLSSHGISPYCHWANYKLGLV